MAIGAPQKFEIGCKHVHTLHRIGDAGAKAEVVVAEETIVLGPAFGRIDLARDWKGNP